MSDGSLIWLAFFGVIVSPVCRPGLIEGFRTGFVLRGRPPQPAGHLKSRTLRAVKPDPLIYQCFRKLVRNYALYK
jgi:hypothetical protein